MATPHITLLVHICPDEFCFLCSTSSWESSLFPFPPMTTIADRALAAHPHKYPAIALALCRKQWIISLPPVTTPAFGAQKRQPELSLPVAHPQANTTSSGLFRQSPAGTPSPHQLHCLCLCGECPKGDRQLPPTSTPPQLLLPWLLAHANEDGSCCHCTIKCFG